MTTPNTPHPFTLKALGVFGDILSGLLDSSGLQAAEKDVFSGQLNKVKGDLASIVPVAESGVGAAVETLADAEIAAHTGPLAPVAVAAANHLLAAVGGDIAQAISHLMAASPINQPVQINWTPPKA